MKSFVKIFPLVALPFCISLTHHAHAQQFEDILRIGSKDAETYLESYITPTVNSIGNGLADGWYNTAKAHKTLGFDLTFSFNMAKIPDVDKLFKFQESAFQNLHLRNSSDNLLPTMVGGEPEPGAELFVPAQADLNYPGGQSITLEDTIYLPVPPGADISNVPLASIPTPTLNLGVGIYKNTDLKIRLLPKQTLGDFSIKMFGIGVLHDVKQWIPVIKNLPFDLSGFFGTTTITANYDIDINETQSGPVGATTFEGKGLATSKIHSTTIQAMISKKLLFFTPYAAIGFNAVKTTFDVEGDYEYTMTPALGSPSTTSVVDPIAMKITGGGGPRATIGARLKLLVFTIHGAYTIQKYNTLSVGLGISVR